MAETIDRPIRTCSDCPWCADESDAVTSINQDPGVRCRYPGAGRKDVVWEKAPPGWCPLRSRPMLLRVVS